MENIDESGVCAVLERLGLLDGLLYLEKVYGITLEENLTIKYWYENLEHTQPYFVKKQDEEWVVHLSLTLSERNLNLLSILPPGMVGEKKSDRVNEDEVNKNHKILLQFFELLNTYTILEIYRLWRKLSFLTSPLKMEFFMENPIFQSYLVDMQNSYFQVCKDIVLGTAVRCAGRGIDRAHLEWGVKALLKRIVFPLEQRSFKMKMEYNVPQQTSLSSTIICRLNRSRLGNTFIGSSFQDPWQKLRVHISTDSWQLYTLFWNNSMARRFIDSVLAVWLSPQKLNCETVFHYTNDPNIFGWPLAPNRRQGFGVLGHTTFLCKNASIPAVEECEKCFNMQPLVKRFEDERL